ncbi:hypothetical protein B0G69_3358 [Paraburkholderia sp. RAU2J]|nr:hypothetical protein B0G69_3358 [Paraburkholderia sp. RAU2J]
MISELEYLDYGHNTAKTNVVMQPDYWRTRIRAVLALPNIPIHIQKQGSELLVRLDRLRVPSRANCRTRPTLSVTKQHPPFDQPR